jgi:hypothetical protein
MKTDRELLELAAKAAGLDVVMTQPFIGLQIRNGNLWLPLADDGDALRLAVSLNMRVWTDGTGVVVEPSGVPAHSHEYELAINHAGDIFAATRRAIVRAAASIGEQMK